MKPDVVPLGGEHAVEGQDMEMDVHIDRSPEPLHDDHRPAARVDDAVDVLLGGDRQPSDMLEYALNIGIRSDTHGSICVQEKGSHFLSPVSTYSSFRNSSSLSPASRTMPPIVKALTGLWRGIVRMRASSVMTTCLPWRSTRKPAFSRALTACWWLMPGSFGTLRMPLLLHGRWHS